MTSRRHLARVAVLQTLFELDFSDGDRSQDTQPILDRNCAELGGDAVDVEYARLLLQETLIHDETVRHAISRHAPEWPLDRMDRISRCILLLSTTELLHGDMVPPAVAMDEAIELAREYGEQESTKFVNGVLNAIAHTDAH